MKKELVEQLREKYNFAGDEIGRDITLEELVSTIMLEYVDLKEPELEEELERFQGRKYSTMGKIELLEEIRGEMAK